MALISIPNTFTVGAVIVASQHNANFSTIYTDYNGNIDNNNIAAAAGIVDTKLNTISTAGKVSGAALTSLSSIPGGAGTVPTANLPSLLATANILNYGTSASSSSTVAPASLKIAYGYSLSIAGSSSQAVTNLPFTSSSSYSCTVTNAVNGGTSAVNVVSNSGSQMTISNQDVGSRVFNWIAIGT